MNVEMLATIVKALEPYYSIKDHKYTEKITYYEIWFKSEMIASFDNKSQANSELTKLNNIFSFKVAKDIQTALHNL